jgi:hypothetical protein
MNTYHIYAVVNRSTGDAYVGMSARIRDRWIEHKRKLVVGQHNSRLFQKAWDSFPHKAFEFVVLWTAIDSTKTGAKAAELYWIDRIGTYNDWQADMEAGKFRMMPEARERAGIRNRNRGSTPEYRATMSAHMKRQWSDPELREKRLKGLTKKFTKEYAPRKTPEMNAANGILMKELWSDPEHRAKRAANIKAERWKDPDAKAKHGAQVKARHAARRAAKAPPTLI